MVGSKSEDTLLFLGFSPKVIKIKPIYKMLMEFADTKQSIDLSDRFNVIIFQESGPIYLDDFTLNFENVLNLLKDYENKIVRANIAGGIFLAATFVIDIYKKISDKTFRLIILMDKGAIKIPEHYLPVLTSLIDKVKDMPFYIDILRLGTIDPEEKAALMKLTQRCGGKIYEIDTPKNLVEILKKVAKKKRIQEDSYITGGIMKSITLDNQPFYENLADKPDILVSLETCSICFKKDDRTVVECPNCKTKSHMDCWAYWAKTSNIGIKNVFRCHRCFNLVKLDKGFVEIVQEGKTPPELEIEKVDLISYLQTLEAKRVPQVVQAEDPLAIPSDGYGESEEIEEKQEESLQLERIPQAPEPERLEPIPQPVKPERLEPIPQPAEPERQEPLIVFSEPEERTPIPQPAEPERLEPIPRPAEPERVQPAPQPTEPERVQPAPQPTKAEEIQKTLKRRRRSSDIRVVICPTCGSVTSSMIRICPKCGTKL